ncbi:hypothetical protein CLV58_101177 [Spirosoma oryzae]|uniref:Uncharacterized protein n=1 Tax=Spirosoma oryzae TaxID=1469603 RepID=A0A2T0TNB2_9BACT|nr:hypothetical protein [Spirosoma oryzae]PRY47111.1 hypothetical protein CLV58_101177 [Spirosoma oryzae]
MAVNLNETATLKLRGDSTELANDLTQLDTKAKELRKTLKEIETNGPGKGSEEWKKYKAELKDVTTETARLKKEVDLSQLTYAQLNNHVKDLNRELKKLKPGTDEFNAAAKRLGEAEKYFSDVNKQVTTIKKGGEDLGQPSLWNKIGGGVKIMATAFQAFMALQVVGYIIDIGKSIFETTAKFEKYEKVLTTALGGNSKAAKESLAAIKQLGAQTAFSVDEITDGYVKMVNRGLRPTKTEMVALTDLAASQGKTFDQLVEGLLDAATGEFERLKEFGMRASKAGEEVAFKFKDANLVVKNTGEGFEVLDKKTNKVVSTFQSQEEATLGVLTALGKMKGVAGQNADMMDTLDGKSSNLGDSFDALKVELGTGLRPIFVAILDLIGRAIPALSLLGKAVGTVLLIAKTMVVGISETVLNTGKMIFSLGEAALQLSQGNIAGAKATWEETKKLGADALNAIQKNVKVGVTQIVDTWKDPNAGIAAQFAGKEQGEKFQKEITKEQEKALKDREKAAEKARKAEEKAHQKQLADTQKANEKALEELARAEAETHINSIKDEEQREFVKLMVKRDREAEAVLRSKASEAEKAATIEGINKRLESEIARTAGEFAEKKRKKAEEELAKQLEAEKGIIEQERQAYNALLDWRELQAKGNSTKLNEIHRERLSRDFTATINRLDAEENAEKAKAAREITDKDQLARALAAISDRYYNERQLAGAKYSAEVAKSEEELRQKKQAIWSNGANAFKSLLAGDLNAFIEHGSKMFEGEKSAWQKRLSQNMEKYEAVGQIAQAAVQFLNGLEQQRAERAIAEAKRIRDEKVAILEQQLANEKAAQDAAELEKQRITQESNDKVSAIKSATESTISSLESQYRSLSSSEEKKKLADQLESYKTSADEKSATAKQTAEDAIEAAQEEAKRTIQAAQDAEKAAIKSATSTKDERIDAAEVTRDAEIAAINKRKDVDQETRKQLLKEAKDKFDTEKKLAEDEAKLKIEQAKETAKTQTELAKQTAKTKTELAKDQSEAELKAIEAVQKGDEKAAKEILAKAKEDQKEKIRLAKEQADKAIEEAEKEKREKLKKVEAEKQTRIQNQKELNRQIEAENQKARAAEAAAKLKAWQAQKKADMATALITGALATLKALASTIWPVNLVFAAMSAVMTGIQVAMIARQPTPQFEKGGFIARGGRHGSSYGESGIALIDRQSGREVGEMEGDEAIISREQTEANRPLIEQMFRNARTPNRRRSSVLGDRDAMGRSARSLEAPPAFKNGGLFSAPYWGRGMYEYGTIKESDSEYSSDAGSNSGSEGGVNDEATVAAAQEAVKEQLRLLAKIEEAVTLADKHAAENTKALTTKLDSLFDALGLRLGFIALSINERTRANTDRLSADLTQALADRSREIIAALNVSNRDNGRGLEALSAQQKLSFTLLNLSLTKGFTSLENKTGKGFEGMSEEIVKAVTELETELLKTLATNHKASADLVKQNQKETVTLVKANQLESVTLVKANQKATVELTRANQKETVQLLTDQQFESVTLLTDNHRETITLLTDNHRQTIDTLDRFADRTEQSLATLDADLVRALESLSNQTAYSLDVLATRTANGLDSMAFQVGGLRGSISAVEGAVYQVRGAVNGVEGAVYGTNQAGRLDSLIGAISSFAGKG